MAARFSDFLVHDGALPVETVRVAVARQAVYGGALDTALLEMDALAEATLWHELAHATGLPIPDPDLVHASSPAASAEFDAVRSERCRAVPVGRRGNRLQLLCGDPIEREALREASAELAVDLELYVVPEVRLKTARQIVYGQPVPPRLVRLLARVLGPEPARRWAQAHAKAPANINAIAPGASAGARVAETALVVSGDRGRRDRGALPPGRRRPCRRADRRAPRAARPAGAPARARAGGQLPRRRGHGSSERAAGRRRRHHRAARSAGGAGADRPGRRQGPRARPTALARRSSRSPSRTSASGGGAGALAGRARPGGAHRLAVRGARAPPARDPLRLVGGAADSSPASTSATTTSLPKRERDEARDRWQSWWTRAPAQSRSPDCR